MIFVVKIAARGDLLLAAPAFHYLRESRPGERLVLIVGESCRDVAEHLPYFDEIRTIDDRALFGPSITGRLRAVGQMLRLLRTSPKRAEEDSTVMILHRDWRYALVAWLAGIAERRGFAAGMRDRLLTHPYRPDPQEHHTDQYLRLVGAPGATAHELPPVWKFATGEAQAALVKARARGLEPSTRPVVALGFGGGRNVKMAVELKVWPTEKYAALAGKLEAAGCQVVWLGDVHDAGRLPPGTPGVVLAGSLSVAETAAVVAQCGLVVANDTMLLHLAGAVDVPALGVFGPTDPAHYAPLRPGSGHVWLGREAVPCSPCHVDGYYPPCEFAHRCMRELTVDSVFERAMGLLVQQEAGVGGLKSEE